MTKAELIYLTLNPIQDFKKDELNDRFYFIKFLQEKYDEEILQIGMEKINPESEVFSFLYDDEDFYTHEDLK